MSCWIEKPGSALSFFFEVLVTGGIFFSLEKQSWLFCVVLFSSCVFSAFMRNLFIFRSQCDRTDVLYCSAGCSAEISYTCGITTWQMPRPYALLPYLNTAGNLRVSLLFHLSLGHGKTLPSSLWHLSSPSVSVLVACPVQNNLNISPCTAAPFLRGTCHFIVQRKPTLLGGVYVCVWGLIAYANMQSTI